MTRGELCRWLQVSERQLARMIADEASEFPVLRFGRLVRFEQLQVLWWLQANAARRPARGEGERRADADGPLIELPEYLEIVARTAPAEYRLLLSRLDRLIHQVASDRGTRAIPQEHPKLRRLAYAAPVPFRHSKFSSFVIVEALASRPRAGARIRVLHPVTRGAEWEPPGYWQKAGSGYWIVAGVVPLWDFSDLRRRIEGSLDYVLGRSTGAKPGE